MTAADVLVESLMDWGVDTVFGLPGDGINGIMEALRVRQHKVRFIQVRHEESAAFMACGYAKFTGVSEQIGIRNDHSSSPATRFTALMTTDLNSSKFSAPFTVRSCSHRRMSNAVFTMTGSLRPFLHRGPT